MDQVNAIQSYIAKLKMQLQQEEKLRSEYQAKYTKEQEERESLEERMTEAEIKLSKKGELVETLELRIDELTKRVQSESKGRKSGFLGGMFSSNQVEQQQIIRLEQELGILGQETEKLHAQLFHYKTRVQTLEEAKDKLEATLQSKVNKLTQLFDSEKHQHNQAQQIIKQQQETIKDYISKVKELEQEQMNLQVEQQQKEQIIGDLNEQLRSMHESLKKLEDVAIKQQNMIKQANSEKVNIDSTLSTIYQVLENLSPEQQDLQSILSGVLQILKQHNNYTSNKETPLISNIEAYGVFIKAQDRLLRIGKKNDALLKQNKQLVDKLQVYKGQVGVEK